MPEVVLFEDRYDVFAKKYTAQQDPLMSTIRETPGEEDDRDYVKNYNEHHDHQGEPGFFEENPEEEPES